MNVIHLYTIWEKFPDLVNNPKIPADQWETFTPDTVEWNDPATGEVHPLFVLDPGNPSGIRYQAIRVVPDLGVARAVCDRPDGKYVYTISDAFYGYGDEQ